MSVIALAEMLDRRASDGNIFIVEHESRVTVSNANVRDILDVCDLCGSLNWPVEIFDANETPWEADELEDEYAPFRAEFSLPSPPRGVPKTTDQSWLCRLVTVKLCSVASSSGENFGHFENPVSSYYGVG